MMMVIANDFLDESQGIGLQSGDGPSGFPQAANRKKSIALR